MMSLLNDTAFRRCKKELAILCVYMTERERGRKREREGERERETDRERERQRQRQTDRQTDRQRQRETERGRQTEMLDFNVLSTAQSNTFTGCSGF